MLGSYSSPPGRYTYGASGLGIARYSKAAPEMPSTEPFTPASRIAPRVTQPESSPSRPEAGTSSAGAPPSAATELFPERVGSPAAEAAPQKADVQPHSDGAVTSEALTESQSHHLGNGGHPPAIGTKARRAAAGAGRSGSPLASRPRFTTGSGRHTFDKALAEDL